MHSPVVLGLDFGGTKIAAAVCEPNGARLGATTVDTLAEGGARATLERGIGAARGLLASAAPDRPLAAVGVATFGIPGEDGVALAPAVPGWSDIALGRELREAFAGARVSMATDVKAAAQAELAWGALAGCDPGIYLNLGTGLAVAIVAGGSVVLGRHGASGEIGYNLRSLGDVGLPLGERQPLEEAVSGMALLREASALLPYATGAVDVFTRAGDDPRMARLLDDFVAELAFHLVNLAVAVDPERIVVGGGMVRSWHRLETDLRRALEAAVPFPPELVPAAFPFDAPLMGALALGTAAAREAQSEGAAA
ncbi:ROK family protein [Rugosimonospora acidiphila]|uniref:ROK family protein n=1 Tax=Rugosimonospora acidiphila TaxID=556531 RepID=A0ABP9S1U6_9ACTN